MLGIDRQHGRFGSDEHRADSGVCGREREVRFAGQHRDQVYAWTEPMLVRHQYRWLRRPGKGLLRRYVSRMTRLRLFLERDDRGGTGV
jgi:hypothetical protein